MTEKEIRKYQYLKLEMMDAYWKYKKWCIIWDHLCGVENILFRRLDNERIWDYVYDYDANGKLITYLKVCSVTKEGYEIECLLDKLYCRIEKIVHYDVWCYEDEFEDFKREVIYYW